MDARLPLREPQAMSLPAEDDGPSEPDCTHEPRDLHVFLQILRGQLQHGIGVGERAVLGLTADLMEIERSLSTLGREVPGLPGQAMKAIDERLADALARIQFQDTVSQQTQTVIQALRRLDDHLCATHREEAADRTQPCVSGLLRDLYDSYICEQQRSIHHTSLGTADTPAVELRTKPARGAP